MPKRERIVSQRYVAQTVRQEVGRVFSHPVAENPVGIHFESYAHLNTLAEVRQAIRQEKRWKLAGKAHKEWIQRNSKTWTAWRFRQPGIWFSFLGDSPDDLNGPVLHWDATNKTFAGFPSWGDGRWHATNRVVFVAN